jgi:hypothetical protein
MKKIILSAALAFMAIGSAMAQAATEGSITYEITVDGLPPEQAMMMGGSEMKVYFKGNKSRTEFTNAFFSTVTVKDDKKVITLIDAMGQKSYTETSLDDAKKKEDKTADPKIEYKDETKKIAGYDCKKAIVTTKNEKGEDMVMNVWYTEKIPYNGQGKSRSGASPLKGLKGAPLEYEMEMGPMKGKLVANNVTLGGVPDSKFKVDTTGYTKKTPEEMKAGAAGSK